MLDGAAVHWGDERQYDNWDRIAEPLFETLVTQPCALAPVGEENLSRLNIACYGFSPAHGDCNAFVAVNGADPKRMVSLSSAYRPFDVVKVSGAEAVEKMLLIDCRLIFVFPGPDGTPHSLTDVYLDG
jgi:hypothetical protein